MLPLGAFSAYELSADDPNYFKSKHYLYEEEPRWSVSPNSVC